MSPECRWTVVSLFVVGLALPAVSAAQPLPSMLMQGPQIATEAQAGVTQQRVVRPDFLVFGPAAPPGEGVADRRAPLRLSLELTAGETFVVALEPQLSAGTARETWSGVIEGVDLGRVTLVLDRANGLITGTIRSPLGMYEIEPLSSGGLHLLKRINAQQLPPEGEPLLIPDAERGAPQSPAPVADSAARIDVLVVYTPAARAAAGGTANMQNAVALAISDTNQSYVNSNITHRLRLVYQAEIDYVESGNSSTDLSRLRITNDGHMDSVHALRNTYGADLVALISVATDVCGIAYLGGAVSDADWAFSVTIRGCMTGGTFAHELGHNMGAHHDRFVVTSPSPTAYNFGYVAPTNAWRTTMAYGNACGSCPRVQYWSNPAITHPGTGLATGVAAGNANPAHNQRTLNETALNVANYRQEIPDNEVPAAATLNSLSIPPGATLISPSGRLRETAITYRSNITYTWNKVANVTWYQLYVQRIGGPVVIDTWHTDSVCGETTCSVTPAVNLEPSSPYFWWIRTWNTNGYGPWSAAVHFQTAPATPPAATLISPSGWDTAERRPVYTWQHIPLVSWYLLTVSRDGATFINTWYRSADVCDDAVCSAQPEGDLDNGQYRWWIQTWNTDGYGEMSSTTFNIGPPGASAPGSPSGTIHQLTPEFRWYATSASKWYQLFVQEDGGPVLVDNWYPDSQCSFMCAVTPGITLKPGTDYTFWVRTYNAYGYGPWSSGGSFTTAPATQVPTGGKRQ